MTISEKVKKIARRVFRITLTTILIILGILVLIILLIQTGPVQNYGRGKIESYLENKLHTKVRIGNLYIGFPTRIIIKNIYLEDQRKDTLVYGGRIAVNIGMFRLLHHELRLNELELDELTLKVKRHLPDSVFNFQFIIDAFNSGPKKAPEKTDSSGGFQFVIGNIILHHIHASYADDATGNDLLVNLGDFKTRLKTFDPSNQRYAIPHVELSDVSGRVRQYKPILILRHMADTIRVHNEKSAPVKLELGDIDFSRIDLEYRNDADKMNASLKLGNFHTQADSIDLATIHIKLKEVSLNNTAAFVHFDKKPFVKPVKAAPAKDTSYSSTAWAIDIRRFSIDNTRLQYDDDNDPVLKKGMDYSHLAVSHLRVHTSDLHADPTNYRATIASIAFDEKSGFVLKNLSAQLNYTARGATLKNLIIQTNNSVIRNQTFVSYKSLDDLKKHPGEIQTNLVFDQARIAVKDVLIFVPSLEGPLKDNGAAVLRLNGKVNGPLKDLRIPILEISGVGNTEIAASGTIKGMPDAKNAFYDLTIAKLKTTRKDILRFVPEKSLPQSIRIPETMSVNGKFTGTVNRFLTNLHILTSQGDAEIKGQLDLNRKSYDLIVSTKSVDLGYLLKQDSVLGKITLDATAKGAGFDPKKMSSIFHVHLADAEYRSYHYRGLLLDANMQNGQAGLVSSMQDANLSYQLHAEAALQEKYPSVKINMNLDTINLQALHLVKDSLQAHINLVAEFQSTNPDSLRGRLLMSDLRWSLGRNSYRTDSVVLLADHSDTGQVISLRSETADIDWTGKYKLTEVPQSFKHFLNDYYKIPDIRPDSTETEKWQIALRVKPSPLLFAMMPELKGTDSLKGNLRFDSRAKDFNLALHDNKIQYNQQIIHQFNLGVASDNKEMSYRLSVQDAGQPGFLLHQSSLYGTLRENKLTTSLLLKDQKAKSRYLVSGTISEMDRGLHFVFNPDSLLLNYQAWQVPADNYIQYNSAGLLVKNLDLHQQSESLSIRTNGETPQSPLDIGFTNFKIKTITQFAGQDSLLLDGTINGKAEIKNLFTKPLFTSDLRIDTLAYEKDTVGNLVIKVNNEALNDLVAHITLKGYDNDVQIDGKYFISDDKMDMEVKLNQLNLASFRSLAKSQIKNMSGYLKGELHASGSLTQPLLKGGLHFDNATIIPAITGEPLKLSQDVVNFDQGGFDFDNFVMLDSAGDKATIDGNVFTTDFKQYRFDLSLSAENFRVVNAPKEPNREFYGKLNLNSEIDITGDLNLPRINAYLRVNKNTDFYAILPTDNPEVEDRNGVVIFVNKGRQVDSIKLKTFLDSLASTARLRGMDVSATVETDSSAQFTLIIDERNGDALAIRGRADLTAGVDKSGKVSLTGNYELVNGSYNLTLNVLHRKFVIQRGSLITWTGDPGKANIDITAIYTVNTAPIDLLQDQLTGSSADQSRYKTRLPFQVKLNMTGELLKPVVKFDIALPDNLLALWPDVDTKLAQMRTDVAETNKQTFALLLLGRFIQQNPFETAGPGTDAGTIAKQSAGKLLSDQMNQIAASLVKGVDVNFDMNSDQDYSSGTSTNQTDLNVKVSKNLFDDRIRVTVGSDFQLEETNPGQNATNIAGDVSIDYKLSKDGRYMLRVYRNDQYETVIQGQVVETGLSFILTFDYNSFRELFQNKKEPPPVKPKSHHPAKPNSTTTTSETTQPQSTSNTPAK